jgi:hypothetical protein
MASTKRGVRLLSVLWPDQQLGSTDRRIHATRVVSPNGGLDALFIQNTLRELSI